MASIGRYIFRTTVGAFLTVTISLTALIWMTQALRDFDLMTSQGQSVLVFVGITGMIIPLLLLVIVPIALFISIVHTLNKLSADSEIIVMNAAGMAPRQLFKAFLPAVLLISVLVAVLSSYLAPKGLRVLRDWITEVRANLVSNIVQPGRFIEVESGVTFHIRARANNGQLLGVFMDDQRNASQRITILADTGEVLENDSGTFLILRAGTVQRSGNTGSDPNIVSFDRYALDLSVFSSGAQTVKYSIRERYLWQLLIPDPNDSWLKDQPGQFRAELYDRLLQPFYPIAFAIIAFAYLGLPRTTRQSRAMSIFGAIGAMALLRMVGFMSTVFGTNTPPLLAIQYIAVVTVIVAGTVIVWRGIVIEPPAALTDFISRLSDRLTRRFATS